MYPIRKAVSFISGHGFEYVPDQFTLSELVSAGTKLELLVLG